MYIEHIFYSHSAENVYSCHIYSQYNENVY